MPPRAMTDAAGVFARLVVAILCRQREPRQNLRLRFLELTRPLADLAIEQRILITQLQIEEACLEQVPDPQQHFHRVERFVEEVLRTHRERCLPRFGCRIGGENQDRQIFLGADQRV